MNRRDFCQHSLVLSTSLALPGAALSGTAAANTVNAAPAAKATPAANVPVQGPAITDTYVNLFEWPFRKLKYSGTADLVRKLKQHRISRAWAGSFEALFHKDMDQVNARLVAECHKYGKNMLLPVGSVNTSWPGWEEDLRRCDEIHGMTGIRLFPIYQMTTLDSPEMLRLIEMATERKMFIQIVGDVADPRHHHPVVNVWDLPFDPLVDLAKKFPDARIQLIHWNRKVGAALLERLAKETNISFDISRIEGAGELGGLIAGNSWYGPESPVPAERFLFGSHAPYFPVESALFKLFESPLTKEQLELIMVENAKKLLVSC